MNLPPQMLAMIQQRLGRPGMPPQAPPYGGFGQPLPGMPPQGMPPQRLPMPFDPRGGMPGQPKATFNPMPFEGMGGLGGFGQQPKKPPSAAGFGGLGGQFPGRALF